MPTAEVLSQGDEVITGQVVDSNAAWLADRLTTLGFEVVRHTAVGDRLSDICAALQAAAARADVCVSTGGLGPTSDDLTAEAVARVFHRPLEFDEEAMAQIESMYARFGRPMPEANRKQAWLPRGCARLDNHWGTAPGFAVDHDGSWLAFMPGVPREMRKMFDVRVAQRLAEQFNLTPGRLVTLRTTGIGESNLQERVGQFEHAGIVLGYRTMLPENHVKLRVGPTVPEKVVHTVVNDLVQRIGSPVFAVEGLGRPGGTLAEILGQQLIAHGHTLACAESCTGGRVAALCTAISGSSAWFLEGAVTYSNAAKVRALGVSAGTLERHGAVSTEVARQMAEGIRERSGATWGLSTTGIAGPTGGTSLKPVGTVHIAVAGPDGVVHRKLRLAGDRGRVQDLAAAAVLDLLRRNLSETHVS